MTRPHRSRSILLVCAAWLAALCLACGFGGDDEAEVTPSLASTPVAPPPPPEPAVTISREPRANAFVCRREHTQGLLGIECWVRQHGRSLIIGGPIGTHVTVGSVDYTLSEADRAGADVRRRYPMRDYFGLNGLEAVAAIEYPREPLFAHLGRVCDEPPATVVDTWTLRVERPGAQPLEVPYPITAGDVAGITELHLALAIEDGSGITLPAATGDAILYQGRCFGGPITQLSDIRYKATSETQTRRRGCGRYQNQRGERISIERTMFDQRLSIVDVHTGRAVRSTLLRAPTPSCPRSTGSRATRFSHVDQADRRAWFERQIARL